MKRICIIGDIFFDIVAKDVRVLPARWSTDTLASSIQQIPGGSALNCSMHASNYLEYKCNTNMKIAVFSAVGNDIAGQTCKDTLATKGCIEDNVVVKDNLRTGSCIVISGDNERCFITDRGCVNDLAIDWFPLSDILATNLIHITGYYNCSGLHAGILDLLFEARSRGILTSLNPQYDATGQWGGIQSLCPFLDIITCNEDELKSMTTGTLQSADFELLHYVDILFSWGCRNAVVVTMGGKGAAVFYKVEQTSSSSSISIIQEKPPIVNVVDSTGQVAQYVFIPTSTSYYCYYYLYLYLMFCRLFFFFSVL